MTAGTPNYVRATEAQIRFIEILAIDLCMDRLNRNYAISEIVGREVRYLDTLSKKEASKVIDDFKERKEG